VSAPRTGRLFLVSSWRLNAGRRERVTRLFRRLPSAERYAERQRELDREPVTLWTTGLSPWQEVGS
jgi:hypothetical protein